ncbi:MAG TPA: PQQ-binding-like beta-propeller repeat protein [Verrucomicrobiae bacterium]
MTPRILLTLAFLSTTLFAENWPFWRGPSRQGISSETGLPLNWSAESNVVWKAPVPGEAWSSPIVYGDQVFVTTTTESGVNCHVIAFDRQTGQPQWNKKVFEQTPRKKEQRNSYATPTPATDGERVYAVFGDGSVVALSAKNGDIHWEHREVNFYSQHGLGSSPILHGDLLIMPFDHSSTGENKRIGWQIPWDQSFLLAFDKKTGEARWKAMRGQSRIAHVTPNIMEHHGREILVSGAGDVVQGFDLQNGKRLWSVYSQGEGVVPSIVVGGGLVYSVSGFEKPTIRAVRPPADTGEPSIVWEQKKSVPMIPSLIFHDQHLYGITEGGVAICLKSADGEIVWQERIGGNHSASPVMAEGRIYFTNEEGESTIIEASPTFKVLAKNSLKEKTQASMAVSQKQVFIRTAQHLFCIAAK